MSAHRLDLVEALSTCSLAQQVVQHEAQRVNQELERAQRHNTRMRGKIKLMEDELKFLKLDLSKAQAANRSYQVDVDRLHSECRTLLWKNFDLEIENDGLKQTLEVYRNNPTKSKNVTSHTRRTSITPSGGSGSHGGSSKVKHDVKTTTTTMTSSRAEPSSSSGARHSAERINASTLTSRYLNADVPARYASPKPVPVRKSSSSNQYHKTTTWSEVTPSTSRTSNVSERHNTSTVRFDTSALRGLRDDVLGQRSMSVPTSHVSYEQRDVKTETHSHARPLRF